MVSFLPPLRLSSALGRQVFPVEGSGSRVLRGGAGVIPPRLWGCPAPHPCTPRPNFPPAPPGHRTPQPLVPGLSITIPTGTRGPLVAQHSPDATGIPGRGQPRVLTSKFLVCEALLVGEEEGEEPVQASRGPPGDDVEEDGSVEDLEDGGRVGSRPLRARRLLPAGKPPALGTGATARHGVSSPSPQRWGHPWGRGSLPTYSTPVLLAPHLPASPTGCFASSRLGAAAFWAPQPCPPAGTGHGFCHAPAPRVKPDRSEQSVAVGRVGDNRPAPGTGNGGRKDSGCPGQGCPGLGAHGASQSPPPTCIPAHPGDRAPTGTRGHPTAPSRAATPGWGQWQGATAAAPGARHRGALCARLWAVPPPHPGSGFLARGGWRPS